MSEGALSREAALRVALLSPTHTILATCIAALGLAPAPFMQDKRHLRPTKRPANHLLLNWVHARHIVQNE